jgi:hypothetical protein
MVNESVLFVTVHKTASTLFSKLVLSVIIGLKYCDYASIIYKNQESRSIDFNEKGYVYGPLRLSARGLVRERLIIPLLNQILIQKLQTIFWIREPRDVLISAFYSFGISHGFSGNNEIAKMQKKK